jgi:uncharacterized protein YkwD
MYSTTSTTSSKSSSTSSSPTTTTSPQTTTTPEPSPPEPQTTEQQQQPPDTTTSTPDQPAPTSNGNSNSPVAAFASPADQAFFISAHNDARAAHGASPVTWSNTLENFAHEWATSPSLLFISLTLWLTLCLDCQVSFIYFIDILNILADFG